jgi:hypothetical protein
MKPAEKSPTSTAAKAPAARSRPTGKEQLEITIKKNLASILALAAKDLHRRPDNALKKLTIIQNEATEKFVEKYTDDASYTDKIIGFAMEQAAFDRGKSLPLNLCKLALLINIGFKPTNEQSLWIRRYLPDNHHILEKDNRAIIDFVQTQQQAQPAVDPQEVLCDETEPRRFLPLFPSRKQRMAWALFTPKGHSAHSTVSAHRAACSPAATTPARSSTVNRTRAASS